MRELVAEAMAKSREDLVRQFSAADGSNPLADFKASTVRELHRMAGGPHRHAGAGVALRCAEKEKLEELEEERERGTAKGRHSRRRSPTPSTPSPTRRATGPRPWAT